jgi:small GTP-binding protein
MSRPERVLNSSAKASAIHFGGWGNGADFDAVVKSACESFQSASKNVHQFSSMRSAKVILIGAPGVGKTSLVLRYCRDIFERNYKTTIGVDFEVEKYRILGVPFSMQIWDTAGAERFRGVTTAYFRGAHVVILAYDITNEETLEKTKSWLREAREFCTSDFYIFLVSTKKDLIMDDSEEFSLREKRAAQFAEDFEAEYWSTSSRTGDNVEELFTRIASVTFERVMKSEIEATNSIRETTGQLAQNSSLIRLKSPPTSKHPKNPSCCKR